MSENIVPIKQKAAQTLQNEKEYRMHFFKMGNATKNLQNDKLYRNDPNGR